MSHTYTEALQGKHWKFGKGNKRYSHISRRRSTTSDDPKRSFGSCSQQNSVIFHKGSERPNVSAPRGREGRSPFMVLKETRVETMLWNGTFPVNTYRGQITWIVSIERLVSQFLRKMVHTSTTTIPNANISACLLADTVPNRTSGADHRTVRPLSDLRPKECLP